MLKAPEVDAAAVEAAVPKLNDVKPMLAEDVAVAPVVAPETAREYNNHQCTNHSVRLSVDVAKERQSTYLQALRTLLMWQG